MKDLRLLIVDDDPRMRESCSMLLDSLKIRLPWLEDEYRFKITEAGTAEEAQTVIDESGADIMLLDQLLPGIQGTDLLEYITEKDLEIQTIMITGNATLDTAISATRNGAAEILVKPFTPDELRTSVTKTAKFQILQNIVAKLDEERKKTRFEFIRVLSHELKSPLAAVTGYLNIMKNKTIGDNVRNIEECEITQIVADMVEGVRQQAEARNIRIITEIPDFKVTVDRVDIEIILTNLLTNAVKYNKEGGEIKLTAHSIGKALKIRCADTGIGMTEEEASRLFSEFTRIRNEKTKNILGNGLGLSILKKVVSLYNGEVSVESKFGEGSEFTVILPGIINLN